MNRLLIVEDSEIVRRGLIRILGAEPGIYVAGNAADGEAALSMLRSGVECDMILARLEHAENGWLLAEC